MNREALIAELQAWGFAKTYVDQRREEVRENPRAHIIERLRRHAPGTLKRAQRVLIGRDGADRRRIMAEKASIRGVRVLPMWACDPVRCTATRKGQWARPQDVDLTMPPELAWVDVALSALGRQYPILELIVRTEFTHDGIQRERAMAAKRAYGGTLTYWQYRRRLDHAIGVLCAVAEAVQRPTPVAA
jgi:hypothetical protein